MGILLYNSMFSLERPCPSPMKKICTTTIQEGSSLSKTRCPWLYGWSRI